MATGATPTQPSPLQADPTLAFGSPPEQLTKVRPWSHPCSISLALAVAVWFRLQLAVADSPLSVPPTNWDPADRINTGGPQPAITGRVKRFKHEPFHHLVANE